MNLTAARYSKILIGLTVFVASFAFVHPVHALRFHVQNELSYRYVKRIYYNDTTPSLFESNDHYLRNFLDMTLSSGNLTLDVRPELRLVDSDALSLTETDPAFTTYRTTRRLMSLDAQLSKSKYQVAMTDVDRLFLTYQGSNWQTTIGRSPLGLGMMRVLTLWNRFSPSLFNTGTTELVFNPDLATISGQWSSVAVGAIEIAAQQPIDRIHLGHFVYYGEWIELQAIGGEWWERPIGGVAFSKDVGGAQLRGESLVIGPSKTENTETQAAAGFEYAVNSRISVLLEWLYQQAGGQNSRDYLTRPVSRFRPLFAQAYVFGQMTVNLTDFLKGDFGTLVNLADSGLLATAGLEYSISDHFDVSASARIPTGGLDQEFGRIRIVDSPPTDIGYPQRYSLQLRAIF
ncbi:MAG: hypothetical protein AAB250_00930 [Bdellovibrionota bacterium]